MQNKTIIQAYIDEGERLKNEGKLQQAIEKYTEALEVAPNCVSFMNELAAIYETKKEFGLAIAYLQRAIQLQPNNSDFKVKLFIFQAEELRNEGQIDEAIEKYTEALLLNANYVPILYQLAEIHETRLEFAKALDYCQDILRLQPESVKAKKMLASLVQRKNFQETATEHQKFAELKPYKRDSFTKYDQNKVILFDLDGVLSDTAEIQVKSTIEAVEAFSEQQLSNGHKEIIKKTIKTIEKLHLFAQKGVIKFEQIEQVYELKKEISEKYFQEELCPDPEKIEIFKFIRKNQNKYAIVTNANRRSSELLLDLTGLSQFVELLITNQDVVNPKPYPEPYIRAMLHLGGKLEDFLIFEDSETGMRSAVATGAKAIKINDYSELTVEYIQEILELKNGN